MAIFFVQYNYGVFYTVVIEKRALWTKQDLQDVPCGSGLLADLHHCESNVS